MSGNGIRALLRSDLARLVFVAALGAAIVLGIQGLTSGNDHARPAAAAGPAGAAGAALSTATAAPGQAKPAAPGAKSTPAGPAVAAPPAAAASAAGTAPAPVADSTNPAALARLPVSGAGLTVVIDQPGGPFGQQNQLIAQGATVAASVLDAAGGVGHHGVRIVREQLDGLTPAAVQARLKAAGPGAVLILPCDANSQSSLAAGAAPFKTLMLAPCNSDASLARRLATYWPVGMAGNDEAAGLAGYMRTVGFSTVFVVDTPGLSHAASMTRYFRAAVQAKRIRVVGSAPISLTVTDAEVRRLAAAIKAARPRPAGVFTALPPPYVDRLAAGLAGQGVHRLVLGTSAMDVPLTLSSPGSAALENAAFPAFGFLRQDVAAGGFLRAYKRRYGDPVGAFPGLGFETIGLLADAVGKARSTDPAAIQRALLGGIDHTGAALFDRSYRRPTDHNPITSVSVEKIYGAGLSPVVNVTPSNSPAA